MTQHYALAFGLFTLDFPQRTLSRDGVEIKLGSRALDILVALAEALGELVSNQALVAKVWPNGSRRRVVAGAHVCAAQGAG